VENLVGTIERPRVLDWEYAHVGEALWDVAGWISNNDFDAELAARLLASYLQLTPSASVAGRLCELIWLYQYVCWLWSKLYLNLHCGTATAPLAARTEILMARLEAGTSSGRIGQVPAH
jgi:thiamine kinase-like enzyme